MSDFSVSFSSGQLIGVIGPNGAGKSTMIKAILGINKPRSGQILIDGSKVTPKILNTNFSYVPQKIEIDFDFPINVFDTVMLGQLTRVSRWHSIDKTDKKKVTDALAKLDLNDISEKQISDLSGGQRQRVLVARSLVQQSEVYLLDEPFVGIDATSENTIMNVLRELRNQGKTVIIVHHDLDKLVEYFDEVVLLNHEVLVQGTPSQVLADSSLMRAYGDSLSVFNRRPEL
ncbi:MAG: metal ABC transporter ATP-binding protein [Lactobacillaceae bacterium]|nr:metal ABC transporter ATP-binding protein [Lactobacillaceae bacterium]